MHDGFLFNHIDEVLEVVFEQVVQFLVGRDLVSLSDPAVGE